MTVIIIFALCWLPLWLFQFLIFFARDKYPCVAFNGTFYFLALYLGHSNSAVNPFLYALFNKNFRQGFRQACMCFKMKRSAIRRSQHRRKFYRSELSFTASRNSLSSLNKESKYLKTLSCCASPENGASIDAITGISDNKTSSTTS